MASQPLGAYIAATVAASSFDAGEQAALDSASATASASAGAASTSASDCSGDASAAETARDSSSASAVASGHLLAEVAPVASAATATAAAARASADLAAQRYAAVGGHLAAIRRRCPPQDAIPYTALNDPARTSVPGLALGSTPDLLELRILFRPRLAGVWMSLWDGGTRADAPRLLVGSAGADTPLPGYSGAGVVLTAPLDTWSWLVLSLADQSGMPNYGQPGYPGPASRYYVVAEIRQGGWRHGTRSSQRIFTLPALSSVSGDFLSAATAAFVGDIAAVRRWTTARPAGEWLYHPAHAPAGLPGGYPKTH